MNPSDYVQFLHVLNNACFFMVNYVLYTVRIIVRKWYLTLHILCIAKQGLGYTMLNNKYINAQREEKPICHTHSIHFLNIEFGINVSICTSIVLRSSLFMLIGERIETRREKRLLSLENAKTVGSIFETVYEKKSCTFFGTSGAPTQNSHLKFVRKEPFASTFTY